jgi:peptidyl-prolyl cis-trans isomerase C
MIPVAANNDHRVNRMENASGHSARITQFALRIIVTGILFLVIGSCRQSATPLSADSPVVAVVGKETILLSDFQKKLSETTPGLSFPDSGDEAEAFKEDLLNQMVTRRLLLAEARRRELSVDPAEVEAEINEMKGEYSESEFEQLMESGNVGKEAWKEKISEELLLQKVIRVAMERPVTVSDEEVNHEYDLHRGEFKTEETVRARQIVVPTDAEAQDIRELLTEGQDFEEIARARSISPDASRGGDLGFFKKGEMPEEFDIVFDLPVGEISPVVRSPFGYHLFRVEEHRPPSVLGESEAKSRIRTELTKNKHKQRYDEWLEELRQKADVRINRAILKSVVLNPKKKEKVL